MNTASDLLARIADHCVRVGIAETTFGRLAANDGKIVSRLRAGKTITLKTLHRIETALAEGGSDTEAVDASGVGASSPADDLSESEVA
jgi:hypothetical protein